MLNTFADIALEKIENDRIASAAARGIHRWAIDLMHPEVATKIFFAADRAATSLAADDMIPTWREIDHAIQAILENSRVEDGPAYTDEELADAAIERLKGDGMWPVPNDVEA